MTNETPLSNEIVVGRIEAAEEFEESRKPGMCKLWIDLGNGEEYAKSAAQLLFHHEVDELEGELVLCVTDLGEVNIAGFVSEVLTVGVPGDDGKPVLVTPDEEVPLGGRLY